MKEEDKTFENERQFMKEVDERAEDRGPNDLDFVIKKLKEHSLTQAKEIDRLNEYVQILEMQKKTN